MSKNLNFIKYFSLLDIKNELIKLGFKSQHDHTKARSLGGKDRLDNVTIMCYHCNSAKNILYENKTHALYKGEVNEINYEEIELLSKSLTI